MHNARVFQPRFFVSEVAEGGIRSFHCLSPWPVEMSAVTELLDDDELYAIDESNFYDDHMGTFAWYLVDYETGVVQKTQRPG